MTKFRMGLLCSNCDKKLDRCSCDTGPFIGIVPVAESEEDRVRKMKCEHVSDGVVYLSVSPSDFPAEYWCKKCREFYSCMDPEKEKSDDTLDSNS